MERWEGKWALVTGASSGIGKAIAENLVQHSVKVVGLARRENILKQMEDEMNTQKRMFRGIRCDLSQAKDVAQVFQKLREEGTKIRVVVNNAGILVLSLMSDLNVSDMKNLIDTNFTGYAVVMSEAIKLMREDNEEGRIININSTAGKYLFPLPQMGLYGASKHAVSVLSEYFRRELAEAEAKVSLTVINPGRVETELLKHTGIPGDVPKLQSEDIASCVKFVLEMPFNANITEICIRAASEN